MLTEFLVDWQWSRSQNGGVPLVREVDVEQGLGKEKDD